MNAISDLIDRAYRDMDPKTGMFPADWSCLRCDKPLNAGGRNPAELYAGTYTGLCYPCSRAGAYVEAVYLLDGAQSVSHPPHCPSWRRNRETFYGYPDCDDCRGSGVTRRGTLDRPYERCDACSTRFFDNPIRRHVRWARETAYRAANDRFVRRVEQAAGVPKRCSKKRRAEMVDALDEAVVDAIRAEVQADLRRVIEVVDRLAERRQAWATEKP